MLTLAHGLAASGGRISPFTLRSTRLLFVALFIFCCFAFSLTAAAQLGRVYGWGYNAYGQTGDGTTTTRRTTPFQVNGLTNVISVVGGAYHTLVLKSDGTVWAWGNNSFGQLGTGNNSDSLTPVQVI
jgi:alpha-tubulin suppressor-like RCC1 family protein